MKNFIIGLCFCLFLFQCVDSNKSKITKSSLPKNKTKVIAHYMGWYSDKNSQNKKLRHWEHGYANTPIIGAYNSKSKATLVYHSLLAWSSGLDAIAINVKDKYDYETMEELFNTIDELQSISKGKFNLKYLISYDDQGFDLQEPLDTTFVKVKDFKEHIIKRKNYLFHKNNPLFFSFDYPKKFLTAKSFRTVIDSVFKENKPYLIWNTFGEGEEVQTYVNAFYPWVQPGGEWDTEGLNWGKGYLNYFYDQVNKFETKYSFVVGGVWAGFDDRKNTSWGGNRLISRQNGKVYDDTWNFIHNYKGKLPMDYVVLETWNDWNEGTEIEPSLEYGYQYLTKTVKHINKLKGTSIKENSLKFELAKEIHDAIQKNNDTISEILKESIELFCKKSYKQVQEKLK
ncbi:Glycosyltransferase WbsX [Polaribacter sp. KT25b]|uniref:glycoside hydrolase family 99-like domain-containing protein n=1 Tax=Polaribacter sp. KT25b TaxID=1855336 RepID=UPI0008796B68|nr:glycoside hydrolase family 99-like domain-containing protein [Polaribacter sp. KT25b]SDR76742.1 Glycosyltransferase WbsX [Polaribacter sp. KT25b]